MKKLLTATLLVSIVFTLTACTQKQDIKNIADQAKDTIENATVDKIGELVASNQSKKCSYTSNAENTVTSGTIYINGNNIANSVKITGSTNLESNYIMIDGWIYTWTSDPNTPAMKIKMSELSNLNPQRQDANNQTPPTNLNYKDLGLVTGLSLACENWTVDKKVFEIPSNVEFIDITQTMKDFGQKFNETTEKVKNINDSKCSACNMAPDENIKRECLASLGCN